MKIQNNIKLRRQCLIACLAVLWTCGSIFAGERSAAESVDELMRRGVTAEKSGRPADATAAYEKLMERDTASEATVAPRLVNLYISLNQPAPALSWATRVARRHPDPQAYLAGVYTRLGQHKESELLLQETLLQTHEPMRRVTLLWQLAEAQEKQGDSQRALATLTDACAAAGDTSLRPASDARIEALRRRIAASLTQQRSLNNRSQAEVQP